MQKLQNDVSEYREICSFPEHVCQGYDQGIQQMVTLKGASYEDITDYFGKTYAEDCASDAITRFNFTVPFKHVFNSYSQTLNPIKLDLNERLGAYI